MEIECLQPGNVLIAGDFLYVGVIGRVTNHTLKSICVCVSVMMTNVVFAVSFVNLAFPFLVFHSDCSVSQCFLHRDPESTERCSWQQTVVVMSNEQKKTILV